MPPVFTGKIASNGILWRVFMNVANGFLDLGKID
jgi:hypothetical protein